MRIVQCHPVDIPKLDYCVVTQEYHMKRDIFELPDAHHKDVRERSGGELTLNLIKNF